MKAVGLVLSLCLFYCSGSETSLSNDPSRTRGKREYSFPPTRTQYDAFGNTVQMHSIDVDNTGSNFAVVAPG